MALGLCCCICLGCIPYMIASLKDVQHKCAGVSIPPSTRPQFHALDLEASANSNKCKAPLATYHRSGRTEVHMGQTAA
ncbi:hypothetical protein IMZ48_42875 [Candidatus Bathyarchaeota archaeon]|nr:hypothetical protein [Candidatus Bathyarchaeota archaeon]